SILVQQYDGQGRILKKLVKQCLRLAKTLLSLFSVCDVREYDLDGLFVVVIVRKAGNLDFDHPAIQTYKLLLHGWCRFSVHYLLHASHDQGVEVGVHEAESIQSDQLIGAGCADHSRGRRIGKPNSSFFLYGNSKG